MQVCKGEANKDIDDYISTVSDNKSVLKGGKTLNMYNQKKFKDIKMNIDDDGNINLSPGHNHESESEDDSSSVGTSSLKELSSEKINDGLTIIEDENTVMEQSAWSGDDVHKRGMTKCSKIIPDLESRLGK